MMSRWTGARNRMSIRPADRLDESPRPVRRALTAPRGDLSGSDVDGPTDADHGAATRVWTTAIAGTLRQPEDRRMRSKGIQRQC